VQAGQQLPKTSNKKMRTDAEKDRREAKPEKLLKSVLIIAPQELSLSHSLSFLSDLYYFSS
jgi:hypothetical protein